MQQSEGCAVKKEIIKRAGYITWSVTIVPTWTAGDKETNSNSTKRTEVTNNNMGEPHPTNRSDQL